MGFLAHQRSRSIALGRIRLRHRREVRDIVLGSTMKHVRTVEQVWRRSRPIVRDLNKSAAPRERFWPTDPLSALILN